MPSGPALSLSSPSTTIFASARAAPTVCAVVSSRRVVPASTTVIVFTVAMVNDSPSRPIGVLGPAEISAPGESRSSAANACSTVVAVVQCVCGRPSTVTLTWRPCRTSMRAPSANLVSTVGITTSCWPTSRPLLSRSWPTEPAVVCTSLVVPSTDNWTLVVNAA